MRKYWTSFACAVALIAAVPLLADDYKKPGCVEAENSGLAEPDWYLQECLGGIPPVVTQRPNGVLKAPLGADLSYLHNIRNAGQFPFSLMTAPVGTLTYTLVGANNRPIFGADFDNTATTLWGIDNTSRELGTYNLTTGAYTPTGVITGIPAAETYEAIEFDPTSNVVYVQTTTGTISNLYTLDINTRVATLVGAIGSPLVIDIAISNTGVMYGHDITTDMLLTINKTTGVGTNIGSTGMNATFAQGMDFDLSTNILWSWFYIGGGVNNLVTFNLNTGAGTLVLNGPAGPEIEGAIKVPAAPAASVSAVSLAVDAAGNRVMDPAEAAIMAPTWHNDTATVAAAVTGALTNFTGPAGGTYTIVDAAAAYGDIAANANASCGSNCYTLTAAAATRPVVHWDTTVLETMSTGNTKTWTLHIGESFTDVPTSSNFYRFIETLLHTGITGGCTATTYCPNNSTTREQMSVFVLIAKEGAGYTPPACTTPVFPDVPANSPFCRFIEELVRRGVTSGCGGGNYCPGDPVTRAQMAVFVLRTLDPALNPPACGTPVFNDVPANDPFCRWIEELARRGVVSGCGGGNYCPADPVTREQMGVFLVQTFSLNLYGL
jgi:hypothetical protein